MRHTFKIFIVTFLLIFTFKASADDKAFSNGLLTANPQEVLKLFENPSQDFSPMKNKSFTTLLLITNYPQSKSFEIQRVFRAAVVFYQKKYQASQDFGKQERILTDMHKLSLAMLANKNIAGTKMNSDYNEYLKNLFQIRDAMNRGEIPMPGTKEVFIPPTNPGPKPKTLVEKVGSAVDRLSEKSITEYTLSTKEDGIIEVTMESLPVEKAIGNVLFLASESNRAKAFKVRITEPSVDAGEAMVLVTEALLSNTKVAGVIFENSIHIPSKLNAASYELYSYGNRVMLKNSAPLCSRLFH